MNNIIEWEVYVGGQYQDVYYDESYDYDMVREDLINNCGFPEDLKLKRIG